MKKILLAEDHDGVAKFIKDGLTDEGFSVEICSDGISALETFRQTPFDLVLLDWGLPGKDGLEVCRTIRETDRQTPVIFLTARDTLPDTIEGLRAGANDYIKKPFSFEELLERIKVQFRHSAPPLGELEVGPIYLDPATYLVTVAGKEKNLTKREFDLLKYLLEHKNQVCTRENIIRDVWDIHFEYDTGVIDVFMNALRKKLGLKAGEGILKTIRGVGYMASDK